MKDPKNIYIKFIVLFIILLIAIVGDLMVGSTYISFDEIVRVLIHGQDDSVNSFIIWELRLTKTIAAILVGIGLPVSGLLLQSLFRNPLAGPFVLGISSGASLGVAIYVMAGGASIFVSSWMLAGGLSLFSILGSLMVLMAVLAVSLRVNDTLSLLVVGLMFGSITAALVSVMQYFSSADLLQRFIVWTFGSLGGFSWLEVTILSVLVITSLILSVFIVKPMNAMLINEDYARSLGVSVKNIRIFVILISSVLAGSITAFAGPIVFIGVAIPHLARNFFNTSDHKTLLLAVVLMGSILMLVCDIISQMPGYATVLPINSVTAIFGAPVVIWIILQNKRINARY
ncbi:MAG: iron ABC transporter permease [Bacteroidetes bacterium]|nr:MAG: iron ABC transporter permease [Bacteroidota bacterium]